MTLKKMGRKAMASMVMMGLGVALTACSGDSTTAYLYVVSSTRGTAGVINAFAVRYQQGNLLQLADSPVPSGGRNPVAIAAAPNGKFIYVVHRDDSSVVEFAIGVDGKLYAQHTYNTTGSFPTSASVDASGKFLYVTFTYQTGYTPALVGPGGVTIFPINSDNTLNDAQKTTQVVGFSPVAVSASSSNHFVYVLDREPTGGVLLGFSQNTSTGALTPVPGTSITTNSTNTTVATGFAAGVLPAALVVDKAAQHLYLTDSGASRLLSYALGGNGVPSQIGSVATGDTPVGLTIDPVQGKYLYVANNIAGSISGYTFAANGAAQAFASSPTYQAGAGPTCVTIEPSRGLYLFTSNNIDGTISGEQLRSDGTLEQIQGTPFTASALPACAVTVPEFPH